MYTPQIIEFADLLSCTTYDEFQSKFPDTTTDEIVNALKNEKQELKCGTLMPKYIFGQRCVRRRLDTWEETKVEHYRIVNAQQIVEDNWLKEQARREQADRSKHDTGGFNSRVRVSHPKKRR